MQDKALRIINFKTKNHPVSELYKSNEILKLTDYIKLLNFMFVKDTLSANQIPIFSNFFKKTMKSTGTIPDTLLFPENSFSQELASYWDLTLASQVFSNVNKQPSLEWRCVNLKREIMAEICQ